MPSEWDLRWRKFDSNGKPIPVKLQVARTSKEIRDLKKWLSLTTEERTEISLGETKRKFGTLTFLTLLLFSTLYWYFAYPIGIWVFGIPFGWILTLFGVSSFIFLKEYQKRSFEDKKQMSFLILLSLIIVLIIQIILSMILGVDALYMGPLGIAGFAIFLFLTGELDGGSKRVSAQHSGLYSPQHPGHYSQNIQQTPQAQLSGYYQCTCGNIQHGSHWGGMRNCSKCGRPMTWRS